MPCGETPWRLVATRSFQALPTHVVALAKAAFLAARPCYGYAFCLVRGDHRPAVWNHRPSFLSKQPSYSHLSCWGKKLGSTFFSNNCWGNSRTFFSVVGSKVTTASCWMRKKVVVGNDGQAMVLWWPGATRAPVEVPRGAAAGCGRWRLRHGPSRQCWRTRDPFNPRCDGRLMTKMLAQQDLIFF